MTHNGCGALLNITAWCRYQSRTHLFSFCDFVLALEECVRKKETSDLRIPNNNIQILYSIDTTVTNEDEDEDEDE
jgi:hypothetical protein